jgi:hypothetical protein
MAQVVKFVRVDVPLKIILCRIEDTDENSRQRAVDLFRDLILQTREDKCTKRYRILVKAQRDLWEEGLRAGRIFELQKSRHGSALATVPIEDSGDDDEGQEEQGEDHSTNEVAGGGYGGGKWGKYLRAPDLYFEIISRYRHRFVPLGEIAEIRRGITTGCDKFFVVTDVSLKILNNYSLKSWKDAPLRTPCRRVEVQTGEVLLVEDGAGQIHPVEAKYLQPEVHSIMAVRRPVLLAEHMKNLILIAPEPIKDLRGTYLEKYLRYGEISTFNSKKSKAVPVPKRRTCAVRTIWYDLSGYRRGQIIWSKGQQYRHIVVHNLNKNVANCRLYDVTLLGDERSEELAAVTSAIANSTLIAFIKFYYGRYTGTEGNFELMASDLNLLELPTLAGRTHACVRNWRRHFYGFANATRCRWLRSYSRHAILLVKRTSSRADRLSCRRN